MRSIEKTIQVINQLKAEGFIPQYAIAGAIAATFYIEPTNTEDVDVFIMLNKPENSVLVSIGPIIERLRELGYTEWEGPNIVVEGWPVQFIPASSELEYDAIKSAIERELFPGLSTFVPPSEHLIAIALSINRPKDKIRVLKFHEEKAYDEVKLAAILDRYGLKSRWQEAINPVTLIRRTEGETEAR